MHHHAWHRSPTLWASAPLPQAALRIYLLCLSITHPWLSCSFFLFLSILIFFPSYNLLPMHPESSLCPWVFAPLSWESRILFNKYVSRAKHQARCVMESVSSNHPCGPAQLSSFCRCGQEGLTGVDRPKVPNQPGLYPWPCGHMHRHVKSSTLLCWILSL